MKHHITKGFTLTEIIIYMFIASLMLTIISSIFYFMNRSYGRVEASYDVQRNVQAGIEQLRRDLSQTSLNSIVVYPPGDTTYPGVSMISAHNDEEVKGGTLRRHFKMTQYGTPQWNEHIFYTLVPRKPERQEIGTPFEGKMGNLVRWHLSFDPDKNPVYPFPTDIKPSQFKANKQPVKIILRGIPLHNAPEIEGMEQFKNGLWGCGGFQVAFIRHERDNKGKVKKEYLSHTNPAQLELRIETNHASQLVQVNIINANISDRTGNLSANCFSFSVYPRN